MPSRRRPTGRVVGIGSLVLAVFAGGAVFASARSGGVGDEPESALPHTAFAFAKVDLQPGGGQTEAVTALVKRFPAAGAQTADAFGKRVTAAMAKALHLDYTNEVSPWLGRRAGIAGFSGADGRPQYVAALQVTDVAAAKAALAKTPHPPAVEERGGYLVLAKDKETLSAALGATSDGSLAKDPDFAADLGKLSGSQIAVVWADNSATADAMLYDVDHGPARDTAYADPYVKSVRANAVGRTVMGLHATGAYAEVVGYTIGRPATAAGGSPSAMGKLPNGTIGAAYVNDAGALLTNSGGGAFAAFGIASRVTPLAFGLTSLLSGGFTGGTAYSSSDTVSASACAVPSPAPGETYGPDDCFRSFSMAPQAASCAASAASPGDAPSVSCIPMPSFSAAPEPGPACEMSSPSADDKAAASCLPVPGPTYAALDSRNTDYTPSTVLPPSFEDPISPMLKEFAAVLGQGATFALGSLPVPGVQKAPNVALIAPVKDAARAEAAAKAVVGHLAQQYPNEWTSGVADGVLTISSDQKYGATLTTGALGTTALFNTAMGSLGEHVEVAVFVNLEVVRDITPGYPREWLPVSAVGLSSSREGADSVFRIRVVSR